MRKIKFRAWDKRRNEYLSGGSVFIGIKPGQIPLDSAIYLDLIDIPDMYKERFILEQYTGLCDKNGMGIYEGDIVEFDDTGEEGYEYKEGFDFQNRAVIIWNNGRFELDNLLSNNSEVLEFMNNSHEEFWNALEGCKVIGNIHKDRELLPPQN